MDRISQSWFDASYPFITLGELVRVKYPYYKRKVSFVHEELKFVSTEEIYEHKPDGYVLSVRIPVYNVPVPESARVTRIRFDEHHWYYVYNCEDINITLFREILFAWICSYKKHAIKSEIIIVVESNKVDSTLVTCSFEDAIMKFEFYIGYSVSSSSF